ncbi:hypothetical protein E3P99_03707 [Wallemia hederae]|uniref:Uncharacterized protein n=1 Tax=Wallemia hederae TaxID=1540922 RepID=A0A4T0FG91_9BASI|nr:hypothetical protein E3P99_03707 [Wallemia hederae]
MSDARSSLRRRLEAEINTINVQLQSDVTFDMYIRALSLLTDVEHLRKTLGGETVEIAGLEAFREAVTNAENKTKDALVYPTLPPTADAVLTGDDELANEQEAEHEHKHEHEHSEAAFVPPSLTATVEEAATTKAEKAGAGAGAATPTHPQPSQRQTSSYTYDYEKERALFEARRGERRDEQTSSRTERAQQEDLSEELVAMTRQLKQNALALSQGLSSDAPLLDNASAALQGNADGMSTQRRQLNTYAGNSRATTCLTFTSIVAVFIAWIVLFVVIKLT